MALPGWRRFRTNQVDVTVGSAPESDQVELEGFGSLYLDCAHEVPLFREFPYTVAIVTPQFANEQPDVVRRIAQTLGQANDMFHTSFGEAVDILKTTVAEHPGKAIETRLGTRAGQLSAWRSDDNNDVGKQHQGGRSTSR